jgi:hypothetical protein
MLLRELHDIDADINRLALELANVRRERAEHQKIWRQRFIDAFDGGMPIRKISIEAGVRFEIVQGILFRSGRTEKARDAVRAQLATLRQDEHQEAGSP